MRPLIVKQLDYDLTPTAGLALVGHYLQRIKPFFDRIDAQMPTRGGVATGDVLRSYIGLLVQGKSDFDAIENLRGDTFYTRAGHHAVAVEPDAAPAAGRPRSRTVRLRAADD